MTEPARSRRRAFSSHLTLSSNHLAKLIRRSVAPNLTSSQNRYTWAGNLSTADPDVGGLTFVFLHFNSALGLNLLIGHLCELHLAPHRVPDKLV